MVLKSLGEKPYKVILCHDFFIFLDATKIIYILSTDTYQQREEK